MNIETREMMKCKFCTSSHYSTKNNKMRSYRVHGITKPGSMWQWPSGQCQNPEKCWGNKIRKWIVLRGKAKPNQWIFRHTTSEPNDPGRSSLSDELRVDLQQGTGMNRLLYSGIASGGQCKQFWPWITVTKETKYPVRKVLVNMKSGIPLPSDSNWDKKKVT